MIDSKRDRKLMDKAKSMENRIKNSRGFTMGETLVAVLILLMVSAVVAAGMPAAKNAYEKVVKASNAEVLLSTTVSTLRNELGTARNVTASDGAVKYYSDAAGSYSKIGKGTVDYSTGTNVDTIMYQRYAGSDLSKSGDTIIPLVSEQVCTSDLGVTYEKVSYSNGVVIFEGLVVNDVTGSSVRPLTQARNISIRVISF